MMKHSKKVLGTMKFLYFFTCAFFLFSVDVHAYIDPSTVTYVVQAVAGLFIALGAIVVVMRHKIIKFFRKLTKKNKSTEAKEEELADKYGDH